MGYVLKIKFENNLRRLTLQKNEIESESFTFAHLESRIRELFQLPAAAPLAVTYTDEEEDVVTMGNDEDLKDALVEQALNPLRIHVTLSKITSSDEADTGKLDVSDNPEIAVRQLMSKLSVTQETVRENMKHVFQACEPLFEGLRANALQALASQATALSQKTVDDVWRDIQRGSQAKTKELQDQTNHGKMTLEDFLVKAGVVREGSEETGTTSAAALRNGAAAAAAAPGTSEAGSGAVPAEPKTCQGSRQFCSFRDGASSNVEGADSEHDRSLSVHLGVVCDVCGASPIVGNRWKSKEKFDYDLCHSCFEKHGNEEEYSKIEQAKFRPRHMYGPYRMGHPFHPPPAAGGAAFPPPPHHGGAAFPPHPFHPMGSHMHGPFNGGRFGPRSFGGGRHHCGPMMGPCSAGEKLYARFVCDVTVFDGTEVAPETQFVKIWRLRNSGTVPWPVNTTLVFVGGDELGHAVSVPLEIPEQGVAPEVEMEVSVDMVAPQKPGRYVSHWRLASPAGPKFGQRLSVMIQVVPKTTLDEVPAELVSVGDEVPAELVSVGDDAPSQESEAGAGISSQSPPAEPAAVEREVVIGTPNLDDLASILAEQKEELLQKKVPSAAAQSGDVEGGIIDGLVENPAIIDVEGKTTEEVTAGAAEASSLAEVEGSISYPVLEVTPNQDPITYPVVDTGVAVERVDGEDLSTTKALLGKLEAMGFTDSKLNAELLEKNGFDLRKTLDDLCAAEEWDPILEELEEMGFYDTVMNRRLMFKNNGSVKRVVKELVQMYRDIQGKRVKVE